VNTGKAVNGTHPAANVNTGGHLDIGLNPEQQQVAVQLSFCLCIELLVLLIEVLKI